MGRRNGISLPILEQRLGKNFIKEAEEFFGTGYDFNRKIEEIYKALENSVNFSQEQENLFEDDLSLFSKVLEFHLRVVGSGLEYFDWLGRLYETLGNLNTNTGQFFTPVTVADMMAEMTMRKSLKELKQRIEKREAFTIADPCCGSGRFFLSLAKTIKKELGEKALNYVVFFGTDLDSTAFQITLINMILFNLNAVVIHGDSLTDKVFKRYHVLRGVLPVNLGYFMEIKKGEN